MFITFEGIEGAGKSTAINYLAGFLQENGHDPLCTREPGGCALGRSLRSILLDARTRELSSRAELFLFLADRAQHVDEVIRPDETKAKIVAALDALKTKQLNRPYKKHGNMPL